MKTSTSYFIKALSTGVAVLVLFATAMFWFRSSVERRVIMGLPGDVGLTQIAPSRLLPNDVERAPNVVEPSVVMGIVDWDRLLKWRWTGLGEYLSETRLEGVQSDSVYYVGSRDSWSYFDRSSGKVVSRERNEETRRVATYYAGPDGVGDSADTDVGHFVDPIGARMPSAVVVYDRGSRRFYAIDGQSRQVRMGSELSSDPEFAPVRLMGVESFDGALRLDWRPPEGRDPGDEQDGEVILSSLEYTMPYKLGTSQGQVPVVNASGRVDLLDVNTLNLTVGAGRLPEPMTYCGRDSSRPSELLDYAVITVYAGDDLHYLGMVTAGVSRQGTSVGVEVYDERPARVVRADSDLYNYSTVAGNRRGGSSRGAYWQVPWGPAMAVSKFLLETVHPPVLTLASFWAVDHIDARDGFRSLFVLPNSFAAMCRVGDAKNVLWQFTGALILSVPAFLLAGFLAWRISSDMASLGRSKAGRWAWVFATLFFSVPAYITYRLTRPKEPLVTCPNCGLPRRPDMERCHRCRSPWDVPELAPPAWRVFDSDPMRAEKNGSSEKDVTGPEQNPDSPVESM